MLRKTGKNAEADFVVSAPTNFRQTASVTAAPSPVRPDSGSRGAPRPAQPRDRVVFDVDTLPPEIMAIFEVAGLSRDDLRNPAMAEFAFNFVKQHLDMLEGKAGHGAQPGGGARMSPAVGPRNGHAPAPAPRVAPTPAPRPTPSPRPNSADGARQKPPATSPKMVRSQSVALAGPGVVTSPSLDRAKSPRPASVAVVGSTQVKSPRSGAEGPAVVAPKAIPRDLVTPNRSSVAAPVAAPRVTPGGPKVLGARPVAPPRGGAPSPLTKSSASSHDEEDELVIGDADEPSPPPSPAPPAPPEFDDVAAQQALLHTAPVVAPPAPFVLPPPNPLSLPPPPVLPEHVVEAALLKRASREVSPVPAPPPPPPPPPSAPSPPSPPAFAVSATLSLQQSFDSDTGGDEVAPLDFASEIRSKSLKPVQIEKLRRRLSHSNSSGLAQALAAALSKMRPAMVNPDDEGQPDDGDNVVDNEHEW